MRIFILIILLVGVAFFFLGRSCGLEGLGTSIGIGSKEEAKNPKQEKNEAASKRFEIHVRGTSIWVGDEELSAAEAVSRARASGGSVAVIWAQDAMTSVETDLRKALSEAGVAYQESTEGS